MEWQDGLSELGYTTLAALLSEEEVDMTLAACARLREAEVCDRHHRDRPRQATAHLADLHLRIPIVGELVERQPLLQCVQHLIGDRVNLRQAELRSPSPGHGEQALHIDAMPKPTADSPDQAVTAIIALVAFSRQNGATRLVPGSHRRPDLQRQSSHRSTLGDEVVFIGPAGTGFVFSGHALHAGGKNRTNGPRPALQLIWQRA